MSPRDETIENKQVHSTIMISLNLPEWEKDLQDNINFSDSELEAFWEGMQYKNKVDARRDLAWLALIDSLYSVAQGNFRLLYRYSDAALEAITQWLIREGQYKLVFDDVEVIEEILRYRYSEDKDSFLNRAAKELGRHIF